MSILIGGPGSTGSSLLRTILNRHPDLFSGAELGLFNKAPVFTDWMRMRTRLLTRRGRRMSTRGWFPYASHNLLHADYGWSKAELGTVLGLSQSVIDFANRFFSRSLQARHADIWIEKTPSNAYCFPQFLEQCRTGKVIHITRNPLDAVASMVNRGMTPYFAAGNWVYNNAAALRVADAPRYHRMTYETLVQDPEQTLRGLTDFLGIGFQAEIFNPREEEKHESAGIEAWTYARTERIVNPTTGTFELSPESIQEQIVTALSAVRIHPGHVAQNRFNHRSCQEVCDAIGYTFRPGIRTPAAIRVQQIRDIARRTCRGYATHWPNQPGSLCFLDPDHLSVSQ